ncbi:MAG: enoyl-CoA hydratase [Frankiales bacterium]|nr:enoyl-CoA hydratase [Frankiales bacterium]
MFVNDICLYEVQDGVATVTLNRPERNNGLTGELELAYLRQLERAAEDTAVRVIIVTGAGKMFCPGADLAMRGGPADEPLPNSKIPTDLPSTIGKPIIAAVNGGCAGAGLAHALLCDLRFAATTAKFATSFSRRGLIAEYGMAWTLPRLVGFGAANDLLLSGRTFDAQEALRLGLVNALFERESLMTETLRYARELASESSPTAMAVIKAQLHRYQATELHPAVVDGDRLMRIALAGPDAVEGRNAFVAKRSPAFPPLDPG